MPRRLKQKARLSANPAYNSFQKMKSRCWNPADPGYKNYGGRGITICPRWYEFDNFFADMGPKPRGLFLDRIDNNGNYEPGNCRWATRKQQNRNRRNNFILTIRGVTGCLSALCEHFKVSYPNTYYRIKSYGWSPEEAMFGVRYQRRTGHPGCRLDAEKVRAIRQAHADGLSTAGIARSLGVAFNTVASVVKGWSWKHISETRKPASPTSQE